MAWSVVASHSARASSCVHGRLDADAGEETAQVGEGHFPAGVPVGVGDGGLNLLRVLVALVGSPLGVVEGLLRQQGDGVVQACR